ncbi:peptidoglycan DD-metalloendopeptidase family protein [Aquimarina sp. D1M17]|uniref:peptidoglycan DD-metalloendopeptidase family protein n=1 Tax=Aquimarina acroporae TaxID=2937283 RepID=UPI0020BDEB55|nr:peptidoglycan DD-metalloendopeptidase family protein [Aquimarina acroporae]MCK8521289.1 peptidoglycan DD-metalloendopeptidase family protein [Aquimarina acroporae]
MKTFTLKWILFLLIHSTLVHSQELIIKKNQDFLITNLVEPIPKIGKVNKSTTVSHRPISLDRITYYADQISKDLILSKSYDFFQGLQSPFDPNIWVFLEREQIGGAFRLKKINTSHGQQSNLIYKKNTNRSEIAFKPIAWTQNPNKIYVEGIFLDAAEEHQGIWILDLESKQLENLDVSFDYMKTPLLSPTRDRFYFVGSLDNKVDNLHGNTDVILEYNIKSKKVKTILKEKGEYLQIIGWKNQIYKNQKTQQLKFSNLNYYLPWDAGVDLCVSRHGTPGPVGSHTHVGRCNIFGPGGHHSYPAIDFATSLSSDQNVRASASGVVSFSGISGSLTSGYGRLVIIRHSDGTRTYYAHNKVNLVNQGQTVSRGQVIAKEGTTGGSTGDHIHFEWRAAGGNASTKGRFTGIGEPRQDYRYRSNNSVVTPPPPPSGDTTAPTTSIGASGGTTQAGDFTANITDNDNIEVTRRFYQALEKYGDNWYANRGNGFFNDNCNVLYSGYTIGAGNWSINNKHLRQSNTSSDNTQLSSFLSQNSGLPYLYEFAAKVESTSGPRKFGIHIMASDSNLSQRGNSYLIWFSGEDNKVRIYETVNNVLNTRAIGDAPQDNKWANYKITYSPAFGVLEVFKNNKSVLKWTDTSPIKNGSSISLRTNKTLVEFDDLKVYKFRAGSSQTITAGSAVTKDMRRRNGKVKSLVRDAAGNWSTPGNLDVTISSLSKQNNTILDDTFLTNTVIVYPNPTDGKKLRMNYHSSSKNTAYVSIYDMLGRKLKSTQDYYKGINERTMDLSGFIADLQKGQYIIKVSLDHITNTIKITKQ